MDAEHFVVNHRSEGQEIKNVCVLLPDNETTVFALAFDLKAVYLSNLTRFMIAPQQSESLWKTKLEKN